MPHVHAHARLDMLHGPIWSALPRFALPVAATAILAQLFNAADIVVVGNFTGPHCTVSVAAVGANSFIISLIVNFFVGISLGANVIIANAVGRDDRDEVQRAVHTAIVMALVGGVLMTVVGELAAAPLLALLKVPDDVFPFALLYLRIYLLGMPVILLYNFEAAMFRSIGETKVPLQVLAISGVLNVALNLVFVLGLDRTVDGVATATVLANIVSAYLLFRRLRRTDKAIHLDLHRLRIDRDSMRRILWIGVPAGVQSAVFSISNIIIQSAINTLGTVVMAGSSAAFNIEIIAYYVLNSFSQACTTFVGQNHGAGQLKRCRRILALCLVEDAIASATAIVLVLTFGKTLLSFFNSDPEVISVGYLRLLMILTSYAFSMLYEVMSGYLRGFGLSLPPAILTTIGVCGVRIVWIATVFPQSPSFQTILNVYPISLGLTAVMVLIALLIFRPSRRQAA